MQVSSAAPVADFVDRKVVTIEGLAEDAVDGPTGGAIANAIRRATGRCGSRMPFNQNNIRSAALKQWSISTWVQSRAPV